MPRMPLNIGLPVLVALLLCAGYVDFSPLRSALLAVGIGVALWTAFSLEIGSGDSEYRDPELEDDSPEGPEPEEEMRPLTEEEQKELEVEAIKNRPLRPP